MKSKERENGLAYEKSIEEEISVNSKRRENFFFMAHIFVVISFRGILSHFGKKGPEHILLTTFFWSIFWQLKVP